jgi:hypothetical protein
MTKHNARVKVKAEGFSQNIWIKMRMIAEGIMQDTALQ